MTCALALAAACLAAAPGAAPAREVAGVEVAEAVALEGRPLLLNGAGLRKKLVFEVYVGALYLPQRCADAALVLAADAPWEITMAFKRDVGHHKILDAFVDAFEKNSPGELEHLRPGLERFHEVLADIRSGQLLELHYLPGVGTTLTVPDGRAATVPGRGFSEAILRTWLGDQPSDPRLKDALLGR